MDRRQKLRITDRTDEETLDVREDNGRIVFQKVRVNKSPLEIDDNDDNEASKLLIIC
jgi:hypothetical protein